jgi:magnesium transporter
MVHNRTMTEPTSGPEDAEDPGDAAGSHDHDPLVPVASAISTVSPTQCLARTRLYRHGQLELEGFPVADISDYLSDESVTIWLDLCAPTPDDLAVLSEEFGLHQLAVEDVLHHGQRSKLDRYRTHLFLSAYWARFDADAGELSTSELSAFITGRALITVR